MRRHNESLVSALVFLGLAACGGGAQPPKLHLDGGSGGGDMANANDTPDLTMTSSTPDMTTTQSGPCNLLAQDCSDPNLGKCAAVDDGTMMNVLVGKCVMPTGTKMPGDVCTRINNNTDGEGYDDCGKGMYCSGLGTLMNPPLRHCRSFCQNDAGCTMGQRCVGLIAMPSVGLCAPTCVPFSTTCGNGLNCSNLLPDIDAMTYNIACRQAGQAAAGAACMSDSDCVANSICIPPTMGAPTICSPLCDMAHLCTNGKACTPFVQGMMYPGVCL